MLGRSGLKKPSQFILTRTSSTLCCGSLWIGAHGGAVGEQTGGDHIYCCNKKGNRRLEHVMRINFVEQFSPGPGTRKGFSRVGPKFTHTVVIVESQLLEVRSVARRTELPTCVITARWQRKGWGLPRRHVLLNDVLVHAVSGCVRTRLDLCRSFSTQFKHVRTHPAQS